MARIRSIKPEFWVSEALGTRLKGPEGRQARLLFIALWNHAEDHGVCRGAPALLRSVAFPYDEDVSAGDVSRWVGLLVAARFVVQYEREGSSYLWVRGFGEHQKIDRKSKTTLPEPSQQERDGSRGSREPSKPESKPAKQEREAVPSPRRALVEPSLQEGKGEDRERMRKGEDLLPPTPQGAREPREGDPCEEHFPPRTAPAADQVALESFAPPDTSEQVFQDLHAALSVKFQIRHGRPMLWSSGNEGVHRQLLRRAEKDGFTGKQAVEEVAKRYGHMLTRLDRPFEPGKFKGATLEALAKPEVWAANALPPAPERRSSTQAPTMSSHDWNDLPPAHQATIDAQLPPEVI